MPVLDSYLDFSPRVATSGSCQAMKKARLIPTGKCWCGCGKDVGLGKFFAAGHDKIAEAALMDPQVRRVRRPTAPRPRLRLAPFRPPRRRHRSGLLVGKVRRLRLAAAPLPASSNTARRTIPTDMFSPRRFAPLSAAPGMQRAIKALGDHGYTWEDTRAAESGSGRPARPVRGRAHRQNRPSTGSSTTSFRSRAGDTAVPHRQDRPAPRRSAGHPWGPEDPDRRSGIVLGTPSADHSGEHGIPGRGVPGRFVQLRHGELTGVTRSGN